MIFRYANNKYYITCTVLLYRVRDEVCRRFRAGARAYSKFTAVLYGLIEWAMVHTLLLLLGPVVVSERLATVGLDMHRQTATIGIAGSLLWLGALAWAVVVLA